VKKNTTLLALSVINGAAEGDASESFTSVGFCSVGAATAVDATSSTTHRCALWAVIPATQKQTKLIILSTPILSQCCKLTQQIKVENSKVKT
jgi:hypothetical protein